MTSNWAIRNWRTTSPLRREIPPIVFTLILLLIAVIGLKERYHHAGIKACQQGYTNTGECQEEQTAGLPARSRDSGLPMRPARRGRVAQARRQPTIREANVISAVSCRNWLDQRMSTAAQHFLLTPISRPID